MARRTLAFALLTCPPLVVAAMSVALCGTSMRVGAALGCLSAFCFCDAWYFVRMARNALELWLRAQPLVRAVLPAPPAPRALFDVSVVAGRVLLNDIDRNGHCNNARFLRECGFGRRDLWQHNGVWATLTAHGGNLVVGSQTVRFRRELSLGEAYTLETRVLCWDARAFYVEHRFVTRLDGNSSSGSRKPFVNAVVLVKNTVLGPLAPQAIVAKLPSLNGDAPQPQASPAVPPDVAAWIASNDISSKLLRTESGVSASVCTSTRTKQS